MKSERKTKFSDYIMEEATKDRIEEIKRLFDCEESFWLSENGQEAGENVAYIWDPSDSVDEKDNAIEKFLYVLGLTITSQNWYDEVWAFLKEVNDDTKIKSLLEKEIEKPGLLVNYTQCNIRLSRDTPFLPPASSTLIF